MLQHLELGPGGIVFVVLAVGGGVGAARVEGVGLGRRAAGQTIGPHL